MVGLKSRSCRACAAAVAVVMVLAVLAIPAWSGHVSGHVSVRGEDQLAFLELAIVLLAAFSAHNCQISAIFIMTCLDPLNYASIEGKQGTSSQTTIWTPMIPIKLTDKLVVIPLGVLGDSKFDWNRLAVNTKTDVWGGGAVVAFSPVRGAVVELLGAYGRMTTEYTRGATALIGAGTSGRYDSTMTMWQVSGSYRIGMGNYSVTPQVGFTHVQIDKKPWVERASGATVQGSTLTQAQLNVGATLDVPMSNWIASCRDPKAACHINSVYLSLIGYHAWLSGIQPDNVIVQTPKERFFGFNAAVGAHMALTKFARVGGRVGWIENGDNNGYHLQGVFTVNMSELLGAKWPPRWN